MKILCALMLTLTLATTSASASPGAVNAKGCHGKPKHCHSASDLSTFRNGRKYVAYGDDR
jgi:hypothetical protein